MDLVVMLVALGIRDRDDCAFVLSGCGCQRLELSFIPES